MGRWWGGLGPGGGAGAGLRPGTVPEVHPAWCGCLLHRPVLTAFVLRKQDTGPPLWFARPSKVKATHAGAATHASQQACSVETRAVPYEPLPSMMPSVTLPHDNDG